MSALTHPGRPDLRPPGHGGQAGRGHRQPGSRAGNRRRHGLAFWLVGYTFAVTMAFSAVPTPLYVLYQARDGFGPLMVTVIFAAYAAGVVASLFLAGHVSDWLGRRRMAAVAVAVNMASGALFLAWPSVTGLIAGRVISGISIGMLTATATAYLSELHAAAHPGRPRTRAEMVATTANLGGLGFGPLLAGFLAQYLGDPLRLPYLVAEALMLVGAISLALAPETVTRPWNPPAYPPQRVSRPVGSGSLFFAAGGAAAAESGAFGQVCCLHPAARGAFARHRRTAGFQRRRDHDDRKARRTRRDRQQPADGAKDGPPRRLIRALHMGHAHL